MPCDISRTFFCFFFPPCACACASSTSSLSGLALLEFAPLAPPPHRLGSTSAPTGFANAIFILARLSASAVELGKLGNSALRTAGKPPIPAERPGTLVGVGRGAGAVAAAEGRGLEPEPAQGVERGAVFRGVRPTTGSAGKREERGGVGAGADRAARSTRAQIAGSRCARLFSARCGLCEEVGTPFRAGPRGAREGNWFCCDFLSKGGQVGRLGRRGEGNDVPRRGGLARPRVAAIVFRTRRDPRGR